MDIEQPADEVEGTPDDEGIPEHGGPAPGKRETGDPQEGLLPPGEVPRAAEGFGTTAEEQREGESLEEKLSEEAPDRPSPTRPAHGRLVEQGSGVTDEEKDEEAAVRDEDEPGGLTGGPDQYVQDDEERPQR